MHFAYLQFAFRIYENGISLTYPLTKTSIPYCENNQEGIDENIKDNNTRVNNTRFKKEISKEKN